MTRRPQISFLADGRRLHLQDGPIDLIVEARGGEANVRLAYDAAAHRFTGLLDQLCDELPELRRAADPARCPLRGTVARRMHAAVAPFAAEHFITPMAAVAGAVAEEILGAMLREAQLERAYVNNGGDIALVLTPGSRYDIGVVSDPLRGSLDGAISVSAESGIRGIATSGWHGRSFSLGIADSVTVLARTAAQADAAATLVANAVNAEHPAVRRAPACSIKDDTDLGERLVTIAVDTLPGAVVDAALARGRAFAQELCAGGLIIAAWLTLQGRGRAVGQDHRVQIMEAA